MNRIIRVLVIILIRNNEWIFLFDFFFFFDFYLRSWWCMHSCVPAFVVQWREPFVVGWFPTWTFPWPVRTVCFEFLGVCATLLTFHRGRVLGDLRCDWWVVGNRSVHGHRLSLDLGDSFLLFCSCLFPTHRVRDDSSWTLGKTRLPMFQMWSKRELETATRTGHRKSLRRRRSK